LIEPDNRPARIPVENTGRSTLDLNAKK